MIINNPTNQQVIDVIEHNLGNDDETKIDFGGFEFWTYPCGKVIRFDYFGEYESDIEELIRYMSKHPVKEVY